MVRLIKEGYEYTNLLDAIQDTIINNFSEFNVHIARGKYPFVSVDVTKNANRNIVGRPRDRFVIRPEANGKITLTCDTCNGYDAEILDLYGIVNYFNEYLSDSTAVESIKRNKRRMKEATGEKRELWFENLGFFSKEQCERIKAVMDGKTIYKFEVIYSNQAGNCGLGVQVDAEMFDEQGIRDMFMHYALSQLGR